MPISGRPEVWHPAGTINWHISAAQQVRGGGCYSRHDRKFTQSGSATVFSWHQHHCILAVVGDVVCSHCV
jgi:hypothetical protein